MEAIFIVDEDYASLAEAWKELSSITALVGKQEEIVAESFRISLKSPTAAKWHQKQASSASQIGWHFTGEADADFLPSLVQQTSLLVKHEIPYRLRGKPEGQAQSLEIRRDVGSDPYLALPFENSLSHLPEFLSLYRSPLAKGMNLSERKVREVCRGFLEHCQRHLKSETPMEIKVSGGFLGQRKEVSPYIWTPISGQVGRHEILQEIRIHHREHDLSNLGRLLSLLDSVRETQPRPLFLQFFADSGDLPPIVIDSSHLYEMTFVYAHLQQRELKTVMNDLLGHPEYPEALTDSFLLLEQREARIGERCAITYTLRKTLPAGTYETRLIPTWEEEELDPEEAVVPFEERTGKAFARIA